MTIRSNVQRQIESAFASSDRPEPSQYITSRDVEAVEDSSEFVGRDWAGLSNDLLAANYNVLFWFTPKAFHYYLPAFLIAALKANDKDALYVHAILQILRELVGKDFCRERLALLSAEQLESIDGWLAWLMLDQTSEALFSLEVNDARNSIRKHRARL